MVCKSRAAKKHATDWSQTSSGPMDKQASTEPPLAELHLHLFGCIRPAALLNHLAVSKHVFWDWYEAQIQKAYGEPSPIRALFEQWRAGDLEAVKKFEQA